MTTNKTDWEVVQEKAHTLGAWTMLIPTLVLATLYLRGLAFPKMAVLLGLVVSLFILLLGSGLLSFVVSFAYLMIKHRKGH